MAIVLNVYTPVIRRENLPAIREALDLQRKETGLEVKWHIVYDMGYSKARDSGYAYEREAWITEYKMTLYPRPEPCIGEHVLNPVLFGNGGQKTGWVMLLSDDNLPVPGMLRAIEGAIAAGATVAVMFPQEARYGFPKGIPADYRQLKAGGVDFAQVVFNAEEADGLHFPSGGCADSLFFRNLWRVHPFRGWVFLAEPVVYYNKLNPEGTRP